MSNPIPPEFSFTYPTQYPKTFIPPYVLPEPKPEPIIPKSNYSYTEIKELTHDNITENISPSCKNIEIITDSSFIFENNMISFKDKSFSIILFHSNNIESRNYINTLCLASESLAGFKFYCANINLCKIFRDELGKLDGKPDHPLYWIRSGVIPYILIFKGGWPISFFNGDRTANVISTFIQSISNNNMRLEKYSRNPIIQPEINIGTKKQELRGKVDLSKLSSRDIPNDLVIKNNKLYFISSSNEIKEDKKEDDLLSNFSFSEKELNPSFEKRVNPSKYSLDELSILPLQTSDEDILSVFSRSEYINSN